MFYVINEIVDSFRWMGLPENNGEIRLKLAKVKFESIIDDFPSIQVCWLKETIKREKCDFPNFVSHLTCMSAYAMNALNNLIAHDGEFVELKGVEEKYYAFNCLTVYDALDKDKFAKMQEEDKYLSIVRPDFAPPLQTDKIGHANIFRIPEIKNKFIVSSAFKDAYEKCFLSGLDFIEIV